MSKIPYMQFYVADYFSDAHFLTTEQHGAYLLLIFTYWLRGKPLPADSTQLAAIAKIPISRWPAMERALKNFFVLDEGFWRHKRVDEELLKYKDKIDKAKEAGRSSGKARKHSKTKKKTSNERTFNGRSTDVQRTLNPTASTTSPDTDSNNTLVPSTALSAAREARKEKGV